VAPQEKIAEPRYRRLLAGLISFRGDTNNVERLLAVVRYFQPPALSRLELTINVMKQLGSYQGGPAPGSLVVRQILAAGIVTTNIVDVEKYLGISKEMRRKGRSSP